MFNAVFPPMWPDASVDFGAGTARPIGFTQSEFDRIFYRLKDFQFTANASVSSTTNPLIGGQLASDGISFSNPANEFQCARTTERFTSWQITTGPAVQGWGGDVDFKAVNLVHSSGLIYPEFLVRIGASFAAIISTESNAFPVSALALTVFGKSVPIYETEPAPAYHYSGTFDLEFADTDGFFNFGGLVDPDSGEYV